MKMAFDWEAFEDESFWTRTFERIKITLDKIMKALNIKLQMKKTLSIDIPEGLEKKNIKILLRPKKYIEIRLRRIE